MSTKLTITIPTWLDKICVWPAMVYRKHKYGYSFRKIYLGEGIFTIVEPPDYYRIKDIKWVVSGTGFNFYAIRHKIVAPYTTGTVYMHRELMNPPDGLLVDHRNGDSLDNRRANLRFATHSENSQNKRKRKNATSRFLGVSWDKRTGRWDCRITHQGKRIWIGFFDIEADAARAYDKAAKKYFGEFAKLNFPEEIERSPRRLNLRLANWLGARLNFSE